MANAKRIEHELVDAWAKALWELEASINKQVCGLTDSQAARLSKAVESLTTTNCWFAAYDVAPTIRSALRERSRAKMAATERSSKT